MSNLMELVEECKMAEVEKGDIEAALAEANGLKDLGFDAAANEIVRRATLKVKLNRIADLKYFVITDEKINDYLRRKAGQVPKKDRFDRFMTEYTDEVRDEVSGVSWATNGTATPAGFFGSLLGGIGQGQNDAKQRFMASALYAFSSQVSRAEGHELRAYDKAGDAWVWNEVPVSEYEAVPPKDVLLKMAEHKARGCFDSFTIASVAKIKDPLLLGRIEGVKDKRWYVAQWGNDISLDDVI